MPPKGPQDPQGPQPQTDHPKENKGLVERLKEMLGDKSEAPQNRIEDDGSLSLREQALLNLTDQSGVVRGGSDEIAQEMNKIAADRTARGIDVEPDLSISQENAKIRQQAREELSAEHGVVPGQEEVEQREEEIRARNTPESGPTAPAA